jgi:hypothetical protein
VPETTYVDPKPAKLSQCARAPKESQGSKNLDAHKRVLNPSDKQKNKKSGNPSRLAILILQAPSGRGAWFKSCVQRTQTAFKGLQPVVKIGLPAVTLAARSLSGAIGPSTIPFG